MNSGGATGGEGVGGGYPLLLWENLPQLSPKIGKNLTEFSPILGETRLKSSLISGENCFRSSLFLGGNYLKFQEETAENFHGFLERAT
jgi:hypothetical protein